MCWLTEESALGRLCREQSNLTLDHIDRVGRRIVQLGGTPVLPSGRESLFAGRPQIREALSWESRFLAEVRAELQAIAAGGDYASEDLLRRILREREDFLCRFQTLDYDETLELLVDDDPLSMEEIQRPVHPIH